MSGTHEKKKQSFLNWTESQRMGLQQRFKTLYFAANFICRICNRNFRNYFQPYMNKNKVINKNSYILFLKGKLIFIEKGMKKSIYNMICSVNILNLNNQTIKIKKLLINFLLIKIIIFILHFPFLFFLTKPKKSSYFPLLFFPSHFFPSTFFTFTFFSKPNILLQ